MRAIAPLLAWATCLVATLSPNVRIRGTTPSAVTAAVQEEIGPQGYVLDKADNKAAHFTQDNGVVAQNTGGFLHVFTDLTLRYRSQQDSTLEVSAFQELRGEFPNRRDLGFRRPQTTRESLEKLQHLLEVVRDRLEGVAPVPAQ